jgi:diguanylate cyclase (GGDEF)-like protein
MNDTTHGPAKPPVLLLIDDEVNILRAVDRLMLGSQLRVLTFSDPAAALPFLADPSVVVIVSDFRMPIIRGTDLLARAQKDNRFARRILLSAYADLESGCEGVSGPSIHHYITKPYVPSYLRATLIQSAVDALFDTLVGRIPSIVQSFRACSSEGELRTLLSDGLGILGAEAPCVSFDSRDVRWTLWGQALHRGGSFPEREDSIIELLLNTASLAAARLSAKVDKVREAPAETLSALLAPQVFAAALGREKQRALRYGTPLSIVLLHADCLRENGCLEDVHHDGETATRTISQIIQRNIRSIDLATARGGRMYSILFPGLDPRGAVLVMKRITARIAAWAATTEGWHDLTTSVGMAQFSTEEKDPASFIARADSAMAYAKVHGPNGIAIHDQHAIVPC